MLYKILLIITILLAMFFMVYFFYKAAVLWSLSYALKGLAMPFVVLFSIQFYIRKTDE